MQERTIHQESQNLTLSDRTIEDSLYKTELFTNICIFITDAPYIFL